MARKPTHSTSPDETEFADVPSKSERKRQVEALQKMGTELVDLTDAQLKSIPLDDELRDAVFARVAERAMRRISIARLVAWE